jgi:hypothetical protein
MYDYCSNGWPTSVDELGGTGIIVYPNPTRDILNIETRLDITVEVYDMMGRLIINDKTKRVNLSGYPSGTYNMILIYNELRISKRVIKQ